MRVACLLLLTAAFAATGWAEEGFRDLFDGRTLDGWTLLAKTGDGYLVKDGKIVCPPGGGGNLFHEDELSDFVLRFEFRLEPGSNNGLCIRCPLQEGSLAYEGNELQIIDDSSPRYKDTKPWQKHGSLYNVFPAKLGALKPVGEWNAEEVEVVGSRVKVTVNDKVILDVDVDTMKDAETLEHHPGLKRRSGHIGFLGHNEPIQFRAIRVREIKH